MISTKVHGYIDYMMGVLLILLPFIFDFPEGIASYFPVILGVGTIIYSFITDYELGGSRIIPMRLHLGMDFLAGVVLIAAPWLFEFSDEVFWPFVVLGVLEIGVAVLTSRRPSYMVV